MAEGNQAAESSHYEKFQQHKKNDQPPANDMRAQYLRNLQEKEEKGKIIQTGNKAGFSNDGMSDLLHLGPAGPLDYAEN